jgi:hypothetical protein
MRNSMWLSQAATATSTDQSTHLLATLAHPTLETQSSVPPRLIAQAIATHSRATFGQPVLSMQDAVQLHALLTTPIRLLVVLLRLVSCSIRTFSKPMEKMQDSTVLSTNKASLLLPRFRVPTWMASRIPLATPTPSPTPPLLAALPSPVRLPRLQASLAPPTFKGFVLRC